MSSPIPTRRMTPMELKNSAERLSVKKEKKLKEEFAPTRTISPDQLTKFYERNYDRRVKSMQKKKAENDESMALLMEKANPLLRKKEKKYPEHSAQLDRIIESQYTRPIRRKEQSRQQLERKHEFQAPASKLKKLSQDEQDQMGDRLCKLSLTRKQALLQKAEQKVYGQAQEAPKLDKAQLDNRINHLYKETLDKHAEKMAKLEDEYTFKRSTVFKKLNPDEAKDTFTRLMNGERAETGNGA